MYAEGGIYTDFDILWVRSLDELRRMKVEVVAANDITSYCSDFPHNIQIGAFLAAPRSTFVAKWLDNYRTKYHLYPDDYAAVSMCEPYKLYEKHPHRLLVHNRLQMIYFNGWSSFIPKYSFNTTPIRVYGLFYLCILFSLLLVCLRYVEIDQNKLADFNANLDWLHNGTHGYHLPRHSSLFTRQDYERADQNTLPIKIAKHILEMSWS